jgi:hypothetical protein
MMNVMQLPTDYAWIFIPFAAYVAARLIRVLRHRSSRTPGPLEDNGPQYNSVSHQDVFRAAASHGGRLTVSELVVESGLTSAEAEKLLRQLTDGSRVCMEIGSDGVVWYEFPELLRNEGEEKKDGN